MPGLTLEEFHHDLRLDILASAEANLDLLEAEFTQAVTNELIDSGVTDGFDFCQYRPASGGIRVDGYWFNDSSLDLFITDFANNETLESLTQTEVAQTFKRVENFFTGSTEKNLYKSLEETSQGYGLSRQIADRMDTFTKVNFFLISEKSLSGRLKTIEDKPYNGWTFSYHIWDISRLYRLHTSKGAREEIEINFTEIMTNGLPCLPAHLNSASYKSYLVVMPASILADLYGKYGSRLLEQNVRSFLQIRGNVNKGIRATILNDPEMFFAYNNGITATAREVEIIQQGNRIVITKLRDLQIVNGGQTTASLFHTNRKDKASLDDIFVQMKLSVVDEEKSEEVIPKISEYANTQNKVNAADFFANHPFHVRMEGFSRRLWAPAQQGAQRESKWFYERARGQYADAQSKLTSVEKKRFDAEYPKPQMFTKTDLAKFDNSWDDNPVLVNFGAQKNFADYARRIGQEWDKNSDQFTEFYFKRAIARAIIFRKAERLVSTQEWYNGGYRANVVAYTIAMLSKICGDHDKVFDFIKVWNRQDISGATSQAIEIASKLVYDDIMNPIGSISNVGEWCKKDACWFRLQTRKDELIGLLPDQFFEELITKESVDDDIRTAMKKQKIHSGIEAQKAVFEIPAHAWVEILARGQKKLLFSPKEVAILQIASHMPDKIPSEKQAVMLLNILEKAKLEAIYQE